VTGITPTFGPTVTDSATFTIDEGEDAVVTIDNTKQLGKIEIFKTDAFTGLPLEGSTFTLWKISSKIEIETIVLGPGSGGHYVFKDLEWGHYQLEEVDAPTGYGLAPIIDIYIGVGEGYSLEVTVKEEIADPRKPGNIGIRKVDENGDALAGAGFTLYNSTGTTVIQGEKFTDAAGKVAFGNLAWGSYLIVETTVPAGYTKADDVAVIVNAGNAGTVIDVVIDNTKPPREELTVLGIQELPFTGMHPAIPISSVTMILGGLAMFIASLKKRFRRKK
jgi:uncharacterized surface anchored protein